MSQQKKTLKTLSLAVGATFVATLASTNIATAATNNGNPFAMHDLHNGYAQVAEAKCGANKSAMPNDSKSGAKNMKCDELKCGAKKAKCKENEKTMKKEGKCGGSK